MNVTVLVLVRAGEERDIDQLFRDLKVHEPGTEVDWLILQKEGHGPFFNGRDNPMCVPSLYKSLRCVTVPDKNYDLGTYHAATKTLPSECDIVICLQARSRPLVSGWLDRLLIPFANPHVGLVGATGSHEGIDAAPFPNPHVRSNAFAIRRDLFQAFPLETPTKYDANLWEAGPDSITKRVLRAGYEARVVSKRAIDGADVTNLEQLRNLGVFRYGEQANLLVSDSRTRDYENASMTRRDYLEHLAWGSPKPESPSATTLSNPALNLIDTATSLIRMQTKNPTSLVNIAREDIAVIIPTFRRDSGIGYDIWSDLLVCLASLSAYESSLPVIIGWDCSNPHLPPTGHPCIDDLFDRSSSLELHQRPLGLSGPAAFTWCAERTNKPILFFLNDDAVIRPDTVTKLIEDWNTTVDRSPIGFMCARSNFIAGHGNIREANGSQRNGIGFASEEEVLRVPSAFPVAAFIQRETYLEAGGFQPAIDWYSDNLLAYDLAKKGYEHFVSRAYVHHIGHRGSQADTVRSYAEENERSLSWLRVHRPDYFHHLHTVGV